MIINNTNHINRISQNYNCSGIKTNELKTENIFSRDLIEIQKNKYVSTEYNNYYKNDFALSTKESKLNKSTMASIFTEIDSEFPNSREYSTYRNKINGDGKMWLDVRIENCPKGTQIDEEEFERAMSKVVATIDKIEYAYDKMGYRASDEWHPTLQYDQTTGKINVTDFIKGAPSLINAIADQIYGTYLKDGSTSQEDLKKIKANLEKIKTEMYDFCMKLAESEEEIGINRNKKYSRVEENPKSIKNDSVNNLNSNK